MVKKQFFETLIYLPEWRSQQSSKHHRKHDFEKTFFNRKIFAFPISR